MKKLFGLLLIAIIALSSCADSKTFERADGTKFVADLMVGQTIKLRRLRE